MTVLEMAEKYYPRLWNKKRIETLVQRGMLTRTQADMIYNGGDKNATDP